MNNTEIIKKANICSNGNIKLGNMGTWSKLMGDENYYSSTLDKLVMGSCGNHCIGCKKDCYVKKSYRYDSVINGHAIRTEAMRINIEALEESLINQLKRKRKPFEYVRINQSGELETVRELEMWINTARETPQTNFYFYTKAYELVIPYMLTHALPKNITVLISIWHEYGIEEFKAVEHLPNVKAFVYLDGFDYEAYGIYVRTKCEAYKDGKLNKKITCDKCKKCMNRIANHKIIGCDAH